MKNIKWKVRAFDTDYGYDVTWEFSSQKEAEMWRDALIFDFGEECQAYVFQE